MDSNETQRVLLSEQFIDDLFYTANITVARTEVVFNNETVVFVKLANDAAPITLSLPMSDIDTFVTAYTDYQHMQKVAPALQDAEAFRAWLVECRDLGRSIGGTSTGASPDNPLALWLSHLYGKSYYAGSLGYGPTDGGGHDETTSWMQAFMDKIRADSDTPDLDPASAIAALDAVTAPLGDLDEHPF